MTKSSSQAPIGIFDSGVGGLTIANAVAKLLPQEQIIYFGDTAHLPYGDKSPRTIQGFTQKIVDFLLAQNCKAIVIACNTASAAAQNFLEDYLAEKVSLINVIDPVVEYLTQESYKNVGIIGTKVTIESAIYSKKINLKDDSIRVHSYPTRSLVPIIEEELHQKKHLLFAILDHYLGRPPMSEVEAMVLGCTHYPIIAEEIDHYFNQKVKIIDTPSIVAKHLKNVLSEQDLLNTVTRKQAHRFYVSDYTKGFEALTELFFEDDVHLQYLPLD